MSIYNLEKDKDKYLSPHSQVWEYRSHINGEVTTNTVIVDDNLPIMFEKIYEASGATKRVITSAYRDYICDKAVGGTGRGTHVEGKAIDVIFYKGNKIIDTKLLSCIAQDLGFGGIARINDRAIHLDVRTGRRYLGDETVSKRTVTTDFYKYYNIERSNKNIDKVCKEFGLSKEFWNKNYNTDLGRDNILELFNKIASKLK